MTVGAHVSYRDLQLGRRAMDVPPPELRDEILYQLSALAGLARVAGTAVRYVKPHGALYNRIVDDERQANAVVDAVAAFDPTLALLGMAGSAIERAAAEASCARRSSTAAAHADGSLVPRTEPGALLSDAEEIAGRAVRMVTDGVVVAVDGGEVAIEAESLCVHGDTPGAVAMAVSKSKSFPLPKAKFQLWICWEVWEANLKPPSPPPSPYRRPDYAERRQLHRHRRGWRFRSRKHCWPQCKRAVRSHRLSSEVVRQSFFLPIFNRVLVSNTLTQTSVGEKTTFYALLEGAVDSNSAAAEQFVTANFPNAVNEMQIGDYRGANQDIMRSLTDSTKQTQLASFYSTLVASANLPGYGGTTSRMSYVLAWIGHAIVAPNTGSFNFPSIPSLRSVQPNRYLADHREQLQSLANSCHLHC